MARLSVIGVPNSLGSYAAGQDLAPAALRAAGLIPLLAQAGIDVVDEGDLPVQVWRPDREHPSGPTRRRRCGLPGRANRPPSTPRERRTCGAGHRRELHDRPRRGCRARHRRRAARAAVHRPRIRPQHSCDDHGRRARLDGHGARAGFARLRRGSSGRVRPPSVAAAGSDRLARHTARSRDARRARPSDPPRAARRDERRTLGCAG